MKHYEIRMRINPTDVKFLGFRQSYNKFQDYTFIKADDFEAKSWKESAEVLTEIFGENEILSMEITYEPTNKEQSNGKGRKHYTVK